MMEYRSALLVPSTFRREGASAYVDATITTGSEVGRSFGAERLAITREAVTTPDSVPVRDSHRSGSIRDILGRASSFRFEPGEIVATLEIHDRTAADLVERGDVKAVSIGYVPTAFVDIREAGRLVRTQTEVSLTENPADVAAKFRSTDVPTTTNSETPASTSQPETTTATTPEAPAPQPIIRAHVAPTGSEDPAASFALEALFCRMANSEPSAGARQFMPFGFGEHAAMSLRATGDTTIGTLSREGVLHRALHGTADFPALLTGAGSRTLRAAYQLAGSPLRSLAQLRLANDFRIQDEYALGGFGTLAEVTEHGEITATSTSEVKESWQLKTFGRTFGLTRKAIINDDLAAFGRVVSELGKAAAETENKALFDLLALNNYMGPIMSDGVSLFNAAHGNLISADVHEPLGWDRLSKGRLLMRQQRGISGEVISITPKQLDTSKNADFKRSC